MPPTDSDCPNARIHTALEKLYAGLNKLAPYIAWKMGVPEHAGEDALQDAIELFLRILQRADEQWLARFLKASAQEQIGYFLTAIRNNMLKAILRNRLAPWPEHYEPAPVPDTAEEVEGKDTYTKALQLLSKRQREVMELAEEGYTANEIADKLGIEPNNVRQQRLKARRKIQEFQRTQDAMP